MANQAKIKLKKFSLGISLKLFLAFWLVIISSVLISYLLTTQFKHQPTQEQADPKQLKLLTNYQQQLAGKYQVNLKAVQRSFNQTYQQFLIIKKLNNNKVYLPRKRIWTKVKKYLKKRSLDNPVTVDFAFTQVTSANPIKINGQRFQLLIATQPQGKPLVNLVSQLPVALRLILLLALSFLCCWLLAKSFSKPLIALQQASKDIGDGKLSTRLTKYNERSDEFGVLARSFNQMAEQLESNISAHQRLLGDVSHELRSPLTRLQLAVALAEKNIGNTTEQQKHLTRCETELDRLDDMIADVLTLSRLEHSHSGFNTEEIELSTLVTQIVSDSQYYANSKNVVISQQVKGAYPLLADAKLLASAISNVINNAVKYSPEHKEVFVELYKRGNKIELVISDQGHGVPEELLTQLFTPFFRVDNARDRNTGGTGLGLAIAQQAIQLHQGKILANNQKGYGLKVTIVLPSNDKPIN
jgi:two-component system sensor histidine kinase CpxA